MKEVDVAEEWQLDDGVGLTFDRTIDRGRVHRAAVSEVFITDVRALGGGRVALAAQLPTCHAYFNDHASTSAVDPLLIMEVCRQAGLATAYELGVATDVVLITQNWDLRVAGPSGWDDGKAIDLRITSEFNWTRVRRGRPRAGTCQQRVFVEDHPIATLRASSQFLGHDELEMLRTGQRGTPPPRSADLVGRPDTELVEPHLVGRSQDFNVVLAGLVRTGDTLSARVALPLANRALFDHSYDHVTMQVLIEAARQLAVSGLADADGARPAWRVARLAGRFARFAELDAPVTVRTVRPASVADEHNFLVAVEQDGAPVADLELTMTREGQRR